MMRRLFALVALAPLACGSDSSPTAVTPVPLSVAVPAQVTAAGKTVLADGKNAYQCTFPLSATVSGTPSGAYDYIEWTGGSADLRLNSNGQASTDALYTADLVQAFGSDRVHIGRPVTGAITYQWTGPFTGTLTLRYSVYDVRTLSIESRAAQTSLACQ